MKRTKSVLMKWMARSLVRLIPMGESAVDFATDVLPTMSEEVYGWWTGNADPEERRKDLEALVQADKLEVQSAVEAAIEDAAADANVPIDTAKRDKLRSYLEQVPDAIRRSMRRPEDSRGSTVPPHLAPRNANELAAILPQRPPKFHAGDRPIPGVDIELVSTLGAGGFGEVWRARKTHLGQDVALKFCLDPDASASLRNETALLRRLMSGDAMHPGIVRLIGTYNDCTALEYEFVEGPDLAGIIKNWHAEGKRPSPRQVIEGIRQIAEIVAFAHQLDPPLVHRDLKPANILVQKKGDGTLRFRLTDFGIGGIAAAKQVAATQRGVVSGGATTSLNGSYSFLYASPQQMRAERPDPSDDVYSLGVIFWQLANGDLGDGAPGGTSWMDDLKDQGYPQAVISAIAKCFDHRADRRHKNAAALLDALRQSSLPPPMPETKKPDARPEHGHRAEPHQRGTVTPERVNSLVDATRRVDPVRPTEPTRPGPIAPPPRKSSTGLIVGIVVTVVLLLSCVIGGLILAAIGAAGDAYDGPAHAATPSSDPRLQGWPTQGGDSFVVSTYAADGSSVVVVQNGGLNYVVHQDGTRAKVVYNAMSGMWDPAR